MTMKKAALFLAILAVLALLTVLWQTLHQELIVTGQGLNAVEAERLEKEYTSWIDAIENRQFVGFVYQEEPSADKAQFVTYTLRLRNDGLLPAEMVEMQLVTEAGDIAAYQEPAEVDIAPGGEGTLSLTLLTASKASLRRDIVVTYYLWGRLYSIRYTLS